MTWSGDVPPIVRAKAEAHGAGHWLQTLPVIVDELVGRWSLTLGHVFDGGTEAFVVAVQRADRSDAVLKIGIPRDGEPVRREIAVLDHVGGRGCAELIESDGGVEAMLLERLGPSLSELGWPIERRHDVLCAAASTVWRHAAGVDGLGLMSGADKATRLIEFVGSKWEQLDHPCSASAVEHAISCAERRRDAHDPRRSMLLHGDVHEWNALLVPGTDEFKLIDPDGLIAEPEYDLGVIMREDPVELLDGDPYERARRLASLTGCDATAIWEWGVIERVSTGLLATEIDLQPIGAQMLQTADRIADDVALR